MERLTQLTQLMNQGGTLGWAVAGIGAFGALSALFVLFGSLLRAGSNVVRFFAMACLVLSLATSVTGLACTWLGRQNVEKEIKGKRPAMAERLQRQGLLEARAGVTLGVPLAGPPIFFALLGLFVASRRRWTEFHEEPPRGLGVAVVLLLLGIGGIAAGWWLYQQPIPGRELDEDGWRVRDLTDALDAGEWETCTKTQWVLPPGSNAQGLGSHFDNQKRCIEHFVGEGKVEGLEKLALAKWLDEPKLRAGLEEKLAAVKAPPPVAVAAPPPPPPGPSADLASVQAKAKACFDKAVKKKPKLTMKTSLAIEVSEEGKVVAVKDTGGGKPDAVRKCAVAATKALKLKAGEPRKLEVPLSFP